jgi:hypothetical protein
MSVKVSTKIYILMQKKCFQHPKIKVETRSLTL